MRNFDSTGKRETYGNTDRYTESESKSDCDSFDSRSAGSENEYQTQFSFRKTVREFMNRQDSEAREARLNKKIEEASKNYHELERKIINNEQTLPGLRSSWEIDSLEAVISKDKATLKNFKKELGKLRRKASKKYSQLTSLHMTDEQQPDMTQDSRQNTATSNQTLPRLSINTDLSSPSYHHNTGRSPPVGNYYQHQVSKSSGGLSSSSNKFPQNQHSTKNFSYPFSPTTPVARKPSSAADLRQTYVQQEVPPLPSPERHAYYSSHAHTHAHTHTHTHPHAAVSHRRKLVPPPPLRERGVLPQGPPAEYNPQRK